MSKGNIRHMFLGGNTSLGFFSYYDYILPQEKAERLIILKGGPGVGKSSFMKNIGVEMVNSGYDVEYMHCSSDNNSIDGVVIPSIKVALVDGTAPHIVDPKNPAVVDEIIYLGDYWNENGIRKNKQKIIDTNIKISKTFKRAYKYLAAAKCIYDDIAIIGREVVNPAGINIEAEKIIQKELGHLSISHTQGKIRKLFISAITPNGICSYIDSLINVNKVYIIKGLAGVGKSKLLSKIVNAAVERGLNVEKYYCCMDPENKIEHIVIPKLNICFVTLNKYHTCEINEGNVIDLNKYVDKNKFSSLKEILDCDVETFEDLLSKAISTIKEAKKAHDIVEGYYIPNMRFDKVKRCENSVLENILKISSSK